MKKTNKKVVAMSLMIATFLTAIEGTVVSTAMPKIASELHGIERMNWVFSIYLLTSAVTVPIFGKLSDLFGRKIIFHIGTLIFLIGSTLCGLATSMDQLIIYRAIQGIGAGAIMPMGTIIIGDVFPLAQRANMFGLISLIWGIAGIVGPLVGGVIVDHITWEWIFFMNIPFGVIAMVMLGVSLHEKRNSTRKKIDVLGALTFSIAMIGLLYALQLGGEHNDWTSPMVLIMLSIFFCFIILFIFIESRVAEPMIPLQLFRNRTVTIVNAISLLASAVLIGIMVYIPMWVQGVLGEGAMLSGLVLMPTSITWTVGSFLVGRLMAKWGSRFIICMSLLILLIGVGSLVLFEAIHPIALLYILTAIQGIGFGLLTAYSTILVQTSVSGSLKGVATSSIVFFRTLGQTIGVAILGTFFNAKVASQLQNTQGESMDVSMLNQLVNPETAVLLPLDTINALRSILVVSLHFIFLLLAVMILVSIVVSLTLPKAKMSVEMHAE